MYYPIVRAEVRRGFAALSRGDHESLLRGFANDVLFSFEGEHAMGGERRGVDGARRWFERVRRLFPGLRFEPLDIVVIGPPWNTRVRTRFRVHDMLPGGVPYRNEGEQWLRLRWGRVVEDRVREDTPTLLKALAHLAQSGVQEAAAPPLTD